MSALPDYISILRLLRSPTFVSHTLRTAACEVLVRRYENLVRSCVRRYRNSPESEDELMQVGYLGLLKAISNFNPAAGPSLSAYAIPCVSGEIKRHFRDKRWKVHVRRSSQELMLEVRKAAEELTHQLGRVPDDADIAGYLGVAEDDVADAQRVDMAFHTWSLDAPLSDEDDSGSMADILGEDDQAVGHMVDMDAVHAHWGELPQREQRILVLRFYGNLTQQEIGCRLGISQMHVSRLLARALTHLRDQIFRP